MCGGMCEGVYDLPAPRASCRASRRRSSGGGCPSVWLGQSASLRAKGGGGVGESSAQEAVNPTLCVMVSVICALDQAEPRHSAHIFSTKCMIPATGRHYAVCGIVGSDLL